MELRRKVIGIPLQKTLQRTPEGFVQVKGKFTSDNRDEVGDIITRSATERALPKYRQWGNIRRMHMPDPVGRVVGIGVEDGLEWNEVDILVIDPKACFEVENGLLKALSVGILINVNDIDMMSDGGWVINDYQLAEISLVDHPANYDAALETLNLSLDAETRSQMREQGIVPVLRSIGVSQSIKGELMDQETNPIVEAVAEAVTEPVAEVEAEAAAEPVVEEAKDLPVESQPVVEEVPAVETVVDPTVELMNSLVGVVSGLQKQFEALVERLSVPEPEAVVESENAKDIGGETDKVAQLEQEVATLKMQIETLVTPVDRKGALPVEESAEDTPEETPEVVSRKLSLREAVGEFVKSKPTR